MALIVNGGKKYIGPPEDGKPPSSRYSNTYVQDRTGARAYYKVKALRCILPEQANELGVPAEAPVFVSPYITRAQRCTTCHEMYSPLIYQVGQWTEAQHFCKGYGGIYVRLPEDNSGKWVYQNDLWDAIVYPEGPLRMGDDRGFQFKRVKPSKIVSPQCFMCKGTTATILPYGRLITNGYHGDYGTLAPLCENCLSLFHETNYNRLTDWNWRYDGTNVTFSPVKAWVTPNTGDDHSNTIAPNYQEFLKRTQSRRHRDDEQD